MSIIEHNLGYLAGTLTSFAFLPQVYKIHETNETKELSLSTLLLFFIGQIMWFVYGKQHNKRPIELFAFITGILYVYLIYKKVSNDGFNITKK